MELHATVLGAPILRAVGVDGHLFTVAHRDEATALHTSLGDEKFKKAIAAYEKTNPLGECPTAEDIVGSILFFASDLSNHVTGQLLAVDGGLLIGMPLKLD